MSVDTPWYEKNSWIMIWLLVFFPVGIYGMWKSSRSLMWKIIVTVLFAGPTIAGILSTLTASSVGY